MTGEPILFCWSGGKDSALALHAILESGDYEPACLLTTFNEHFQRVSMHGVRIELVERQAEHAGIPLEKVVVSQQSSNEDYEAKMSEVLLRHRERGIRTVAFGDIFLADLRAWREDNLARIGMQAIFPLWKQDTRQLIQRFIDQKFQSILCCTNDAWLGEQDVGKPIDEDFLSSLPPDVDPCGENGEYHSFVFDAPFFRAPIPIKIGEKVYHPLELTHGSSRACPQPIEPTRNPTRGFWFCDLLLDEQSSPRERERPRSAHAGKGVEPRRQDT